MDNKNKFDILINKTDDDKLVVSSRAIAEGLGKRHDNVLTQIENILSDDYSSKFRNDIIESKYMVVSVNREYKEFLLTKKGFTLYMFNITGHNDFKMKYIDRFEEMEEILNQIPNYMELMRKQTKEQLIADSMMLMSEVKDLQFEVIELKDEINTLEEVVIEKDERIKEKIAIIQTITDSISVAEKRTRINHIIRNFKADDNDEYKIKISKRFDSLYEEFGRIHRKNIKLQSNNLKISPMEYIDKHLGKIDELYELCLKLFESNIEKLKEEFFGSHMIRGTE